MMKKAAAVMIAGLVGLAGCAGASDEKTESSAAAFEQTSLQLIRGVEGAVHLTQSTYSAGPSGYHEEARYQVNVESANVLYLCFVRHHTMPSTDPNCEGQRRIGRLGGLAASGIPLYRCNIESGRDHFITTDPGCEGQTMDAQLGFIDAVNAPVNAAAAPPNNGGTGEGSGDAPGGGGGDGEGGGSGGVGVGGSL